jgi:capsular polysaccharide biosynthesis protein
MNGQAASRGKRSDRRKIGGKPPSVFVRLSPAMRRALAVVALAALAGLAALIVVSSGSTKYERESSFAIRPSDTVPPDSLSDVTGTLSQPDSAVTESIVDILGSDRLRDSAARDAGISPDSVAASGAEYTWLATRRPGSTIVDLRITGPDPSTLATMQSAAGRDAANLVESNYSLYSLETLNGATSADRVGPKTAQTVFLAILLGALVGLGLLFVEGRLRSFLGDQTSPRGSDGRRNSDGDMTGETDQLESALRESLGAGASVRRVAPGRIEVAPPEEAPERETGRRKP